MMAEVVVHEYSFPPAVMSAKEAAAYLRLGESKFREMCRDYPDRLRAFNLSVNGQQVWRTETLQEFAKWRESVGVERAG